MILTFVLLVWGIIIIFAGRRYREICKSREEMIRFRMEQAADCPQDIIENALAQMKERWNITENCVICHENFLINKQGKIEQISLELLDDNYVRYTIGIGTDMQDAEKITGTIHRMGEIREGEQFWSQGIPFYKNSEFLAYLQTGYPFERDCSIVYYMIGKVSADPESRMENFENLFLQDDENGAYYCFHTFERNEEGTWDGKLAVYVPVH